MTTRPLSLAAGTLKPGTSVIDAVRTAAATGYAWVGLRPAPTELTTTEAHRVRRAATTDGTRILDVEVVRIGSTPMDTIERLVDFAAEVGAAHILVVSDCNERDRTIDVLGEIGEMTIGSAVRPVLEFMRFTGVPDLGAAVEIVTSVRGAIPGVLVDVLHLVRSGGRPPDLLLVDRSLLPYVQLCDAPRTAPGGIDELADEARHLRRLPGDGDLPLVEFLLATVGLTVSIEVQSDEGWATMDNLAWAAEAQRSARRLLTVSDDDPDDGRTAHPVRRR